MGGRLHRVLAGPLLALALVAGCGGPVPPAPAPGPGAAAPTSAAAADEPAEARPLRLRIPGLDVDTSLIDLGLQADGTMEVPADGTTAGWYVHSPVPGELGPAVLAAHVDWQGERGVFFDLHRLAPGDRVEVDRADGTATFAVRRVERYAKDAFPGDEVYGDVDSPQLRLITCGGEFDRAERSYRDNVVVYAELV